MQGLGHRTSRLPANPLFILARSICELPQGSIRVDKETVVRGVGRTVEERTFIETEGIFSMIIRSDSHNEGARAFLEKRQPKFEDHGL